MYLEFITDEDLEKHIKKTLEYYRNTIEKIDLAKFNSNIVDPIKLTFDSIVYDRGIESIIIDEIARQRDKSNTNAIGFFNQDIFEYIKGCSLPDKGFDVVFDNGKRRIYVELKNKHNTMNSSSSQKTYMRMQAKLLEEPECECFLVEVIAKKSQNVAWSMSLDSVSTRNDKIRRVSMDKFYEVVTGDKDAFMKLCKVLPKVIKKVVSATLAKEREQDTVFEELAEKDKDLLKALYLLAFKTYEGFNNF
ncbi:MAG: Eco47II family restriction endonuclease [Firmicutes bacterium]|nr:Eco47II family restriction endonuclease [Bacillota bacterium]